MTAERAIAPAERRPIAGAQLLHPVVIGAVVVLVVNDHFLKRAYPGFVTGKLSDVAGLTFFPLLLQALWEALQTTLKRTWRPTRRALVSAVVATALVFSIAKTTERGADAYRLGLGLLQWPISALKSVVMGRGLPPPRNVAFTRDPSDLIALPALAIPLLVGLRRIRDDQGP